MDEKKLQAMAEEITEDIINGAIQDAEGDAAVARAIISNIITLLKQKAREV